MFNRFPYKKRLEAFSKSNPEKILGVEAYNVLVRNGKGMYPKEIDAEIPGTREPGAVYKALRPYVLDARIRKVKDKVGWEYFEAYGGDELTFDKLLGINEFYEDPSMKDVPIPEPPHISKLSEEE